MSHWKVTRREWLRAGAALGWPFLAGNFGSYPVLACEPQIRPDEDLPPPGPSLWVNEDDSHFFMTRAGKEPTVDLLNAWVDQYAMTQVGALMLNPNAMRTSYASRVWDPIWKGYDPDGPDDQPLFAGTSPDLRSNGRKWVHTALAFSQKGIDVYACWIVRSRTRHIAPWISVRMNDAHSTDQPDSYLFSDFWRNNPQFRLDIPYAGFDYGQAEVRRYHMSLIQELAARYDFDGLELDWMRFPWYFRPGQEAKGARLLSEFVAEVRSLLDEWQLQRKHPIRLGVRVPSRPQAALGRGLDAVTWATEGLIDQLVVTPFLVTTEFDMPIQEWRSLLRGTEVTLVAGLELMLKPFPDSPLRQTNTLKTVRGAAASLLDLGADGIYLFNYMDSQTTMSDVENYGYVLREAGSLATLAGKPRRHVLTYGDTWAPGEQPQYALPAPCLPETPNEFRLPAVPPPLGGSVFLRIAVAGASQNQVYGWEVRVNGRCCEFIGLAKVETPRPDGRYSNSRSFLPQSSTVTISCWCCPGICPKDETPGSSGWNWRLSLLAWRRRAFPRRHSKGKRPN